MRTEPISVSEMDFQSMKRKELQALCKKHKIPANLTNMEMINRLSSLLKEKEKPGKKEKPVTRGRSCLKNVVVLENENDLEGVNRQRKKVRFSPENEMIEFVESKGELGVKKKGAKRKSTMRSLEVKPTTDVMENLVRTTRSQAKKFRDGGITVALPPIETNRTQRGLRSNDTKAKELPLVVDLSSSLASDSAVVEETNVKTRRSLRSREMLSKKSEKVEQDVEILQKNHKQKSSVRDVKASDKISEKNQPEMVLRRSKRSMRKVDDYASLNQGFIKNEVVEMGITAQARTRSTENASAVVSETRTETEVQVQGKLEVVLQVEEPSRYLDRNVNRQRSVMPQIETEGTDVVEIKDKKLLKPSILEGGSNNENLKPNDARPRTRSSRLASVTNDGGKDRAANNIGKSKTRKRRREDPILEEQTDVTGSEFVEEPPRRSLCSASKDKIVDEVVGRKNMQRRSETVEGEPFVESTLDVKEQPILYVELPIPGGAESSIGQPSNSRGVLNHSSGEIRKELGEKSQEKEASTKSSDLEEFREKSREKGVSAESPEDLEEVKAEIPASDSAKSRDDQQENEILFPVNDSDVAGNNNTGQGDDKMKPYDDNISREHEDNSACQACQESQNININDSDETEPEENLNASRDVDLCQATSEDASDLPLDLSDGRAEPTNDLDIRKEMERDDSSRVRMYHRVHDEKASVHEEDCFGKSIDPKLYVQCPLAESDGGSGSKDNNNVCQKSREISFAAISDNERIFPSPGNDTELNEAEETAEDPWKQKSSSHKIIILETDEGAQSTKNVSPFEGPVTADSVLPQIEVLNGDCDPVSISSEKVSDETYMKRRGSNKDFGSKEVHPKMGVHNRSLYSDEIISQIMLNLEGTPASNSMKVQSNSAVPEKLSLSCESLVLEQENNVPIKLANSAEVTAINSVKSPDDQANNEILLSVSDSEVVENNKVAKGNEVKTLYDIIRGDCEDNSASQVCKGSQNTSTNDLDVLEPEEHLNASRDMGFPQATSEDGNELPIDRTDSKDELAENLDISKEMETDKKPIMEKDMDSNGCPRSVQTELDLQVLLAEFSEGSRGCKQSSPNVCKKAREINFSVISDKERIVPSQAEDFQGDEYEKNVESALEKESPKCKLHIPNAELETKLIKKIPAFKGPSVPDSARPEIVHDGASDPESTSGAILSEKANIKGAASSKNCISNEEEHQPLRVLKNSPHVDEITSPIMPNLEGTAVANSLKMLFDSPVQERKSSAHEYLILEKKTSVPVVQFEDDMHNGDDYDLASHSCNRSGNFECKTFVDAELIEDTNKDGNMEVIKSAIKADDHSISPHECRERGTPAGRLELSIGATISPLSSEERYNDEIEYPVVADERNKFIADVKMMGASINNQCSEATTSYMSQDLKGQASNLSNKEMFSSKLRLSVESETQDKGMELGHHEISRRPVTQAAIVNEAKQNGERTKCLHLEKNLPEDDQVNGRGNEGLTEILYKETDTGEKIMVKLPTRRSECILGNLLLEEDSTARVASDNMTKEVAELIENLGEKIPFEEISCPTANKEFTNNDSGQNADVGLNGENGSTSTAFESSMPENHIDGEDKKIVGLISEGNTLERARTAGSLEVCAGARTPPLTSDERDKNETKHLKVTAEGNEFVADVQMRGASTDNQCSESTTPSATPSGLECQAYDLSNKKMSRLSLESEMQDKGKDFCNVPVVQAAITMKAKDSGESTEEGLSLECSRLAAEESPPDVVFGDPNDYKCLDEKVNGRRDEGLTEMLCKETDSEEKLTSEMTTSSSGYEDLADGFDKFGGAATQVDELNFGDVSGHKRKMVHEKDKGTMDSQALDLDLESEMFSGWEISLLLGDELMKSTSGMLETRSTCKDNVDARTTENAEITGYEEENNMPEKCYDCRYIENKSVVVEESDFFVRNTVKRVSNIDGNENARLIGLRGRENISGGENIPNTEEDAESLDVWQKVEEMVGQTTGPCEAVPVSNSMAEYPPSEITSVSDGGAAGEGDKMKNSIAKDEEGATTLNQINSSVRKMKGTRSSLIQGTDVKLITTTLEMKENAPSIKRENLGSITLKSNKKRRALEDLQNN